MQFRKGLALCILPCACTTCFAQYDVATVIGTVTDTSGGLVPRANLKLENVETGVAFSATSDGNGIHRFLDVRVGQYRLKAQAPGYLVGTGKEGRHYLLDTGTIGGEDHRTSLYRSELVNNEDAAYGAHGFWGSFATCEDAQSVRWVFAPSWGPPRPKARPFPTANREASNGSIGALRANSENSRELFSSGDTIASFTHFGGIALSNGRVFVSTYDGYVYAFGLKNQER